MAAKKTSMIRLFVLAGLALGILARGAGAAAPSNPGKTVEGPVAISLSLSDTALEPGDALQVAVTASFEPGWRFKEGSFEARFGAIDGLSLNDPGKPDSANTASAIAFGFQVAPDAALGKRAIKALVKYQAVSEDFSAPAVETALAAEIDIVPPGSKPPKPPEIPDGQVSAWHAWFTPSTASPGQTVVLTVEAIMAEDWHTYSITQPEGGPKPTEVSVDEAEGLSALGAFKGAPYENAYDSAFEMNVESYSGKAQFTAEFKVDAGTAPGTIRVSGRANAMFCDAINCMPPMDFPFEAELKIEPAAPGATPAPAETPSPSLPAAIDSPPQPKDTARLPDALFPLAGDREVLKSQGMIKFIVAAILAGFAALLTPCVFPMIPITISYFTKNTGQSSAQAAGQALLYCVSIIVSFLVLGILLSALLGAAGAAIFAANPFVNLFIAALFIVFALSLFGAFEIQIPTEWLNKIGLGRQGGGLLGIIGMGFVFTVTSFTCTVGFVGAILVLSAQGEWFWPIVGMLFFAGAFSLPFFFLALFPQALSRLPKSGGWLNSVKVVMGLLEMALALKFISNVDLYFGWGIFTRSLLLACWAAVAGAVGLYLLGLFRLVNDGPSAGIGPARLVFSLFFLTLSLYLASGLTGREINRDIESYLPPDDYLNSAQTPEAQADELPWKRTTYPDAIETAKREGKPLFIDFTGIYCNNCRLMEAGMFRKSEVKAELKRFTLAQLYTDTGTPESKANQKTQIERFGSAALPLYVLIDPETEETIAMFPGMTRNTGEFLAFLRSDAKRMQ